MKLYPAYISLGLAVWIALMLSGCSFNVGIDWNGKTDKSNTTESPKFRSPKH